MALSRWQKSIEHYWYSRPGPLWVFYPLEWLFTFVSNIKRKQDSARQLDIPVPVMVVGNISVGGTGKTPTLICLLKFLVEKGMKPGVVSRGFGRESDTPLLVKEGCKSTQAGEEPILIFQETGCPVSVHSDRQFAAKYLLKECPECDVILADDGLQHYKLKRDFELALVDGTRLFGNQHLLPLGPLREKPERLNAVDWIVLNKRLSNNNVESKVAETTLNELLGDTASISVAHLQNNAVRHIQNGHEVTLESFRKELTSKKLNALAAIGNPTSFFDGLAVLFENLEQHSYPDHYYWRADELQIFSGNYLLCTSKDAIKISELLAVHPELDASHWYSLQAELVLQDQLKESIYAALLALKNKGTTS